MRRRTPRRLGYRSSCTTLRPSSRAVVGWARFASYSSRIAHTGASRDRSVSDSRPWARPATSLFSVHPLRHSRSAEHRLTRGAHTGHSAFSVRLLVAIPPKTVSGCVCSRIPGTNATSSNHRDSPGSFRSPPVAPRSQKAHRSGTRRCRGEGCLLRKRTRSSVAGGCRIPDPRVRRTTKSVVFRTHGSEKRQKCRRTDPTTAHFQSSAASDVRRPGRARRSAEVRALSVGVPGRWKSSG